MTDGTRDIAEQAEVELAVFLQIEESLRLALQWVQQGCVSSRKLSTLRFAARSFERHLNRSRVLADHGGYLTSITIANPHLSGQVKKLNAAREDLQANFERIILQLEDASANDAAPLGKVFVEMEQYLSDLKTHGQQEIVLLQRSYTQEVGGSG